MMSEEAVRVAAGGLRRFLGNGHAVAACTTVKACAQARELTMITIQSEAASNIAIEQLRPRPARQSACM
jgi:hypothetical protein